MSPSVATPVEVTMGMMDRAAILSEIDAICKTRSPPSSRQFASNATIVLVGSRGSGKSEFTLIPCSEQRPIQKGKMNSLSLCFVLIWYLARAFVSSLTPEVDYTTRSEDIN